MTTNKTRWWLVGLVCLALWPARAPAQGGLVEGADLLLQERQKYLTIPLEALADRVLVTAPAARGADNRAAPKTPTSREPSCGPAQTPATPRGRSSPRHGKRAELVRKAPLRTSPKPSVRSILTEGHRRSYFGPPQPDNPAASVGDYCTAVLTISLEEQITRVNAALRSA
ncbi:MAG: hypothetical protein ACE5Q3_06000, partial [Alphaproteobacteria bacterium]